MNDYLPRIWAGNAVEDNGLSLGQIVVENNVVLPDVRWLPGSRWLPSGAQRSWKRGIWA